VRLHADVIPHGLRLDPATTRLRLSGLEAPFVAAIHLPRDRVVTRDLSFSNPDFRTLGEIDSLLQCAVLTNEDGGFWRHHGFSEEAVRGAIAHNLRVGAFRRGAGTITMQLARNLFLGHERTLARKGQEVVLAWVLEHLAGVSKRRLLEIYLNVIEWGPDVHGANEAARFYFGKDAGRLTIDEALFLTIVIPSPSKWRWRLDDQAQLRPFARAQMHFIGRAMVAKGWLRAEELPPADQLDVRIEGPARDLILPPGPASAPVDTLSASLHRHSWWRFPWSRR
jgi:membrane peptidoglycan carboxypeptidase